MAEDERKPRVLLPPGTYRLTAHVALDADLTEEQLVRLFVRLREAGVPVSLPADAAERAPQLDPYSRPVPEPFSPEDARRLEAEEARKARKKAQAAELVLEYERLLGPGPRDLRDAIMSWLTEFDLTIIRDVFEDVARMRFGAPATKFQHVKQTLRRIRLDRDRGVPPVPRGGGER
jgi:hypothetical protein